MVVVGKKITFAQAEEDELFYWADKNWRERVQETERLRRMIWAHILGKYPEKIEKIGNFVKWSAINDI